jgi:hypothetical protein
MWSAESQTSATRRLHPLQKSHAGNGCSRCGNEQNSVSAMTIANIRRAISWSQYRIRASLVAAALRTQKIDDVPAVGHVIRSEERLGGHSPAHQFLFMMLIPPLWLCSVHILNLNHNPPSGEPRSADFQTGP